RVRLGLMGATIGLVLDCADADKQAAFWAEALRFTNVWADAGYILLLDPNGVEPRLILQQVPEPKPGKNRMHFDIHTADVEGEASRLESLGAPPIERTAE